MSPVRSPATRCARPRCDRLFLATPLPAASVRPLPGAAYCWRSPACTVRLMAALRLPIGLAWPPRPPRAPACAAHTRLPVPSARVALACALVAPLAPHSTLLSFVVRRRGAPPSPRGWRRAVALPCAPSCRLPPPSARALAPLLARLRLPLFAVGFTTPPHGRALPHPGAARSPRSASLRPPSHSHSTPFESSTFLGTTLRGPPASCPAPAPPPHRSAPLAPFGFLAPFRVFCASVSRARGSGVPAPACGIGGTYGHPTPPRPAAPSFLASPGAPLRLGGLLLLAWPKLPPSPAAAGRPRFAAYASFAASPACLSPAAALSTPPRPLGTRAALPGPSSRLSAPSPPLPASGCPIPTRSCTPGPLPTPCLAFRPVRRAPGAPLFAALPLLISRRDPRAPGPR